MLLMKNHAINQSTQLEYGVENYDTEVVDCDCNAEVVDCDYNAEVEYSACLISMFCLNYVIALLSRLKNPSMGRSGVVWQEGQSSCKFQSLPKSLSRC